AVLTISSTLPLKPHSETASSRRSANSRLRIAGQGDCADVGGAAEAASATTISRSSGDMSIFILAPTSVQVAAASTLRLRQSEVMARAGQMRVNLQRAAKADRRLAELAQRHVA